MNGPSARAMKRGVPPTALKARTGEFTPPGITFCARSKSCALVSVPRGKELWSFMASMDVSGAGHVAFFGAALGAGFFAFFAGRQRPEEAVGDHVAHAGAKTRVQRLVEEGERFAHRHVQFAARSEEHTSELQ